MFINWSESQTFGKIEYGLRFDEKIFGSNFQVTLRSFIIFFHFFLVKKINLKIQVKLNAKPLGSTTSLQCLVQQFSTIDLYNQFDALINSSYICPINLYSKFNL